MFGLGERNPQVLTVLPIYPKLFTLWQARMDFCPPRKNKALQVVDPESCPGLSWKKLNNFSNSRCFFCFESNQLNLKIIQSNQQNFSLSMYICNTCAKHFKNISNCLVTKKVFQKWKTLDQSEKFVHSKLCPPHTDMRLALNPPLIVSVLGGI